MLESEINMKDSKIINLDDYMCQLDSGAMISLKYVFLLLLSKGGAHTTGTLLSDSKSFADDITTDCPIRIKMPMPQGIDVIATAEIVGKGQDTGKGQAVSFTIFAPLEGEYILVHTSITVSLSDASERIYMAVYVQKPELTEY